MTDDPVAAGPAEPVVVTVPVVLDAPVVAVTVYPDRARVTRRETVRLPAGDLTVVVEPLPLAMQPDSVRVGGRGPATVLGVDVARRHRPRTADPQAAGLERERRELVARVAELDDADAVEAQRIELLRQLARRAGASYGRALANGDADVAAVAELTDALAAQQGAAQARQRALARRREELGEELAALDRRMAELSAAREPDRLAATIGMSVERDSEVEVELSYVVSGAGWQSSYDLRLDEAAADRLTATWYGLVRQQTGEDWPECDLRLSTARPSGAVTVPELDPWYLDRVRPIGPPRPMRTRAAAVDMLQAPAAPGAVASAPMAEAALPAPPVREVAATAEQGLAAATYQPARPVAVPSDGGAHRATVAVVDVESSVDYVTAPLRAQEAHLRATVVNTSAHTLPPGPAAVFHGADFVGSTRLDTWAPGEEVELALGVDDRVRVERELVRRTATKATLTSTRRRDVEYRTTVANHTPRPARVTVLDQLPVSRDDQITVKELRADPAPAERTDLGVYTWRLELAPGESREVYLGFRVEVGKGVELAGWRE